MRKRLLVLTMAFGLSVASYGILTVTIANAQCGCSCSAGCGDTCDILCSGCTVSEITEVTESCCEGARKATGDLGPCPESGGVS